MILFAQLAEVGNRGLNRTLDAETVWEFQRNRVVVEVA
jgi:hypothetical protein